MSECWVVEKEKSYAAQSNLWAGVPSASDPWQRTAPRSHPPLAPMSPSSTLGAPSNVAAHVHASGAAALEGTALPWLHSTTDWRRHPPSRSRLLAGGAALPAKWHMLKHPGAHLESCPLYCFSLRRRALWSETGDFSLRCKRRSSPPLDVVKLSGTAQAGLSQRFRKGQASGRGTDESLRGAALIFRNAWFACASARGVAVSETHNETGQKQQLCTSPSVSSGTGTKCHHMSTTKHVERAESLQTMDE